MSEPKDLDLLYGVAAIAKALGMTRGATQYRVEANIIPTFRLGGTICARRSTLNAWLAECEAKAREEAERAKAAG